MFRRVAQSVMEYAYITIPSINRNTCAILWNKKLNTTSIYNTEVKFKTELLSCERIIIIVNGIEPVIYIKTCYCSNR